MAAPSRKWRAASGKGADGVVLVKKIICSLNEPFLDGCALSRLRFACQGGDFTTIRSEFLDLRSSAIAIHSHVLNPTVMPLDLINYLKLPAGQGKSFLTMNRNRHCCGECKTLHVW